MAALYEFKDKISCIQAISWSKDSRIAICTDTSVKILTVTCQVDNKESKTKCHQSFIPVCETIWDIPQYVDAQYRLLLKELSREDQQALIIDKIMNPYKFQQNTLRLTGFCCAAWSPTSEDDVGRSILATLSHDFRLCLHTQGSSLLDWFTICDLSEMRQAQTKPEPSMLKPRHFQEYRDLCYNQASVVICWCETVFLDEQKQYSVLAAGTKSGQIVLWRVNMPCIKQDDCSILTTFTPHQCQPSCLSWSKTSGVLVVGYIDGQVHIVQIDMSNPVSQPTYTCIYQHSDLMTISCVYVLPYNKTCGDIIILNKEHCILAFHVNSVDGRLIVGEMAQVLGQNLLHATGMDAVGDSEVLMSSLDGMLQLIKVDNTPQGLKMCIRKLRLNLPAETSWTCLGVTTSPNHMLLACVVRPVPGYDHLDFLWKYPTKVHIRRLDEENHAMLIHDEKVPLSAMTDVLEVYRQHLIQTTNSDVYGDTVESANLSCRKLKIRRYSLLLKISTNMKNIKTEPEIVSNLQMELYKTTNTLFAMYIQTCVDNFTASNITSPNNPETCVDNFTASNITSPNNPETCVDNFTASNITSPNNPETCVDNFTASNITSPNNPEKQKQDLSVLGKMLTFLGETSESMMYVVDKLEETRTTLTHIVGSEDSSTKCCICSCNMMRKNLQWNCENGHTFEVCCKTLQPCEDMDYTTCSLCRAHAWPVERLKEFMWVPGDLNRCTFCDSLLL